MTRTVPDALTEGYEPKRFTGELPYEHDHIRDWASFLELAGPEGVKILARYSTIGHP